LTAQFILVRGVVVRKRIRAAQDVFGEWLVVRLRHVLPLRLDERRLTSTIGV
jgi:hypothetical protein